MAKADELLSETLEAEAQREDVQSTPRVAKRTDSMLKWQAFKQRGVEAAMGLVTSTDDMTEGRVLDPGKVAVVVGGGLMATLVVGGVWIYSMRGPVSAQAQPQAQTSVADNQLLGGTKKELAVPAKPIVAGADLAQRAQEEQDRRQQPNPVGQRTQRQAQAVDQSQFRERSSGLSSGQGKGLAEKLRAEALDRVQMRQNNRDPLTGSNRAGVGLNQLPPPGMLPVIQSTAMLPPLSYPAQSVTNLALRPQGRVQTAYENQSAQNPWSQGASGGYRSTDGSFPVGRGGGAEPQGASGYQEPGWCEGGSCNQGSWTGQQNRLAGPTGFSGTNGTAVMAGGWRLLPPGNLVRVVSRSTIQVGRSNREKQPPVFVQIKGTVKVDGVEVIPDGAVLMGRVVGVDESLSRVSLEFDSLAVGQAEFPVRGASAWTLTGSQEEGSISEGLVAEATGKPNYFVSDAASAAGQAASTVARTLGQQSTTGVGGFGSLYTSSSYSGDLNSSLQRGFSQGLSQMLTRQVSRSDQATGKLESQGAVLTVRANTEFLIYFAKGI
ncbi:MAG: hypothetical protein H7Y22_13465 [Gemmatimonadaceae bacterium]|nr:hypothetical protein [Gloeobacterales cyanobacterium ES-bin-141]